MEVTMSQHKVSILTLALALFATACSGGAGGSGGGGGADACAGGPGEFAVTISGDDIDTTEFCGVAQSELDGSWGLKLLSTHDISFLMIGSSLTATPDAGTYDIVDFVATDSKPASGDFVGISIMDPNSLGTTYASVTGTLIIESSSANSVSGTFEFTASDQGNAAAKSVNFSGSFTSEEAP